MTAAPEVGRPIDASYRRDILKAELVETINQHCFDHGPKIVEALLTRFDITQKPYKERRHG